MSAEHEVFYREIDNRAVKCTYSGTFGICHGSHRKEHATPLFYLHRLLLSNLVFASDLLVEGVAMCQSLLIGQPGEQPSIVTSQSWITAADPNQPTPSEDEIADYMQQLGFSRLKSPYRWQRNEDNVTVYDARPDNFVKSAHGVIPIDLVIGYTRAT